MQKISLDYFVHKDVNGLFQQSSRRICARSNNINFLVAKTIWGRFTLEIFNRIHYTVKAVLWNA